MTRAYLRNARLERVGFTSPLGGAVAAAYRAVVLRRLGYTVADVRIARQLCRNWYAICHVDPDQDPICRTDDFCSGEVEGCDVLGVYQRAIDLVGDGMAEHLRFFSDDDGSALRIANGLQCFGVSGAPFVLEAAVKIVDRIAQEYEDGIYVVAGAIVQGDNALAVLNNEVQPLNPLLPLVEAVQEGVAAHD
ncbi:hypothetical protein ACP6NF_04445 [Alcaligenes faecalis]|uniref:hypothetical protein n=1 Tax=Alcaligenes faecalis TaxID=511 RepID=UPI0005AB1833|nr:hypothetical protein [Alcaligenes faecalis]ATI00423.1 hypothetical protein CPY64_12095 [Alcaligenes faecalis]AYZ93206.1 hypothetical protein EGY22_17865 [Alcaligenes faecalis]MCX5596170.1 hypothetical protein [Alcaligenes faecalis]QQC30993.1 hypothetical protein I6H81_09865 [Alcaligenes faecalis]CAJ0907435.1 Copine domain-containing protein [Alcaligenes faecalis subsp. faecalis]